MSSLLRCFSLLICIWTSPQSSQMSCEYYSEDLPLPLSEHVASYSPAANSMYIMGGFDSSGSAQRTIYKLNLDDDASSAALFTQIGSIPDEEWDSSGVQALFPVEDILYVIGVYDAAHTVNRFNTTSNQWLMNGAEPLRKAYTGCVAYNGSHFVMIDGWSWTSDETQYVYIQFYDIARDVWSMHIVTAPFGTTGLPTINWRHQYCAFADDKLYIFGGKTGLKPVQQYLDGMWRYDILNQQFISIGTLPHPCGYGTTAADGFGHMYLVGCYSGSMYTNQIFVFDASTETIATDIIYTQSPAVSESAAAIFNRQLWIFGGKTSDDMSAKVQICDINISSLLPRIPKNEPTAEPSAKPTTTPSLMPSATPSAVFPSSGKNETSDRDLLLSIIIVLVSCGCFCFALWFFLWSRNKRDGQEQEAEQPKSKIVSVASSSVPQPAINQPPVLQMQPNPLYPHVPPPPPPQQIANLAYPPGAHMRPHNFHQQAVVQPIIVVNDDAKLENEDVITAEGQLGDDAGYSLKTRSSDSSALMHEYNYAVFKVTNFNGMDEAQKLEIFEKDKNKEQDAEYVISEVDGPNTNGENDDF